MHYSKYKTITFVPVAVIDFKIRKAGVGQILTRKAGVGQILHERWGMAVLEEVEHPSMDGGPWGLCRKNLNYIASK